MALRIFRGVCGGSFLTFLIVTSALAQSTSPAPISPPAIEVAPLAAPAGSADAPKGDATPALAPSPAPSPAPVQPQLPQGALITPEAVPTSPAPTLLSLAPPVSEVTLPDSLELPAKPALIVHGKAQWETAYDEIRSAFTRGRATAAKAGLNIVGYPITIFVETNDTAFTYDAILPIASIPDAVPPDFPTDTRLGTTPSGKAIRFAHLAAYDEIDGAYEQITAYLDAKDIVVKDAFIEEYLVFGDTSSSPATTINIFVQPKK